MDAQIPAPGVPLTRAGGLVDKPWYQAFALLFSKQAATERQANATAALVGGAALTVATLPSGLDAGARRYVTDANATTFASVVAGGGSNGVPVYFDGTDWRIG